MVAVSLAKRRPISFREFAAPTNSGSAPVAKEGPAEVRKDELCAARLYDSYAIELTFSPDSRHVAYVVHGGLKKGKSTVVIDGREGDPYDDVLGGAMRKERGEGLSQWAVVFIAREGRDLCRVTQPLP